MMYIEIARVFSIISFLPILLYTTQKWALVRYFGCVLGHAPTRQLNKGPRFATIGRQG
jgi:hypothetical protein